MHMGPGPPCIIDIEMRFSTRRNSFRSKAVVLCCTTRRSQGPEKRAGSLVAAARASLKNSLLGPPSSSACSPTNTTLTGRTRFAYGLLNTRFVSLHMCRRLTVISWWGSSKLWNWVGVWLQIITVLLHIKLIRVFPLFCSVSGDSSKTQQLRSWLPMWEISLPDNPVKTNLTSQLSTVYCTYVITLVNISAWLMTQHS